MFQETIQLIVKQTGSHVGSQLNYIKYNLTTMVYTKKKICYLGSPIILCTASAGADYFDFFYKTENRSLFCKI